MPLARLSRRRLYESNSVPYKLVRATEIDNVPVHRQCFPLTDESLDHQADADQTRDGNSLNEGEAQSNLGGNPPNRTDIAGNSLSGGEAQPNLGAPSNRPDVVPAHAAQPQPDAPECISDSSNSRDSVARTYIRMEHKLRNIDYVMGWFSSNKDENLEHPPLCAQARKGDIFVCKHNDVHRAWLWNDDQWKQVCDNEPHPLLAEHRLRLQPDGTPNWVTRQTITTYRGRLNGKSSGKSKRSQGATIPNE
ncbi:hypothetical protein BJ138DRAFT_1117701 [Hygrophoropsis aurantiaca]|uniref:Uncharacterized protein n=1 Tax=Hygrophoropsis aurantiaca TaxID=72124 RepID=A0ACB7ZZC3_9AGAM|nr:hypothetical protein BJ138DRAFT_1117701 [Hygrophoropsis aurantiaca]